MGWGGDHGARIENGLHAWGHFGLMVGSKLG